MDTVKRINAIIALIIQYHYSVCTLPTLYSKKEKRISDDYTKKFLP